MKIYDKIIECRNNNIERKKREEWSTKRIQERMPEDNPRLFTSIRKLLR